MHLGVVMTGNGAHAAASVGVLQALLERGLEPCAVCGMQSGALPAALYLSGMQIDGLVSAAHEAAARGNRLLPPRRLASRVLLGKGSALLRDERLERLLIAGTKQRLLPVCPRTGALLCRFVRTGHHAVFSTRAYAQESGAMLSMQATVGFAARAAAALPPFLSPMVWMGSYLLPETDVAFACRQVMLLGAQRVLVVSPSPSLRTAPDVMDLTGMAMAASISQIQGHGVAVLHVPMPDGAGALAFDKMPACMQAGRDAAERELDRLFEEMGMAFCRVLPFRGSRA